MYKKLRILLITYRKKKRKSDIADPHFSHNRKGNLPFRTISVILLLSFYITFTNMF